MKSYRVFFVVLGVLFSIYFGLLSSPSVVVAADTSEASLQVTPPTENKAPALDRGDNAWLLVSSALVLMMTGPGLALFYSGLVRKKNVLSVMMQCVFLMCLMSVIWALYGYTLGFGGDTASTPPKWIGNMDHVFMKGVSAQWVDDKPVTPIYPGLGIPRLTHMLFQGMFFIITPALICGAFAERMKFSTMVVFMILWGTFVYLPLCHWVWGGGILMYGSKNAIAILPAERSFISVPAYRHWSALYF
jgi:ammonium transporter, Amt family